ncbi:hypothetical protein [Natronomonas sp. EA1]|uniref:hypothetical protein n=1 Tax=Natronomonas sp. EA1 TaxID=3421655 RepID=UPI003EBD3A69
MAETPDEAAVREMVRLCAPEWILRAHERSEFGTDFVCFVTCDTPEGEPLGCPPAHNLAKVETHLVADTDSEPRQRELRDTFRTAYAAARPGWTFDADTEGRMATYTLVARLGTMACLPLWHEEKSADERDAVERRHRAALGL